MKNCLKQMSRSLPQTLLYSGPQRALQSRLISEFSGVPFSKAGPGIAQEARFDIKDMQTLPSSNPMGAFLSGQGTFSKEQKDVILSRASKPQRELIEELGKIVNSQQVEARYAQEFLQNVSKVRSVGASKILSCITRAAKAEVEGKPLKKHTDDLFSNMMHIMFENQKRNWEHGLLPGDNAGKSKNKIQRSTSDLCISYSGVPVLLFEPKEAGRPISNSQVYLEMTAAKGKIPLVPGTSDIPVVMAVTQPANVSLIFCHVPRRHIQASESREEMMMMKQYALNHSVETCLHAECVQAPLSTLHEFG